MTEPFHHHPVMVDEIAKVFEPVPAGVVLDATLGGGGHAERLLDSYGRLRILGLDRDELALAAARQRLGPLRRSADGPSLSIRPPGRRHGSILSRQPLRGTVRSRRQLAATRSRPSAASRTGTTPPSTCAWTARRRGPPPTSSTATRSSNSPACCSSTATSASPAASPGRSWRRARSRRRRELAAIVVAAIPAPARRTGGHPAKRTFQAIRIEVNGELDALAPAIDAAIEQHRTRVDASRCSRTTPARIGSSRSACAWR